jgi:hypothetical protein
MRTARTLEAKWWQVLRGSLSMGAKEDELSTGHVGYWISPCYGPFLPGACFENYELFISLIFKFLGGPH